MASVAVTKSIADHVAQSLASFEAIDTDERQVEPGDTQLTFVQSINDQLSKFKLWAGNIGAHRIGRSSLDYRLRDSSHLHTQVVKLLDDLISSLNEVHSILSGERLPWDRDFGEVGELDDELKDLLRNEEFEFDSELEQLAKEISDAVSNLLRLSISLRNPAPHDRFMSTEYAKVRYFEASDKAHVEAKFPKASQTLIERLGKALSQRRQYFRYRESHHEKLARGLFDSGRSDGGAESTVASSIPLAMRDPDASPLLQGELDDDDRSDTAFSQTSFATTAPDSGRLRIPPLPSRSYDGPFECPFCFILISLSNTYQWKKHVLRDLRPYICLVEDCPVAGKEYGRRHDWINHMVQKHWKTWACPYRCGIDNTTETNLREHVTNVHGTTTRMELDAAIAKCGQIRSISPSSPVACPLCHDTLESVQQYQRHVGRHQVDLALFVLPRIEDEDEELDENDEDRETISTNSRSYSAEGSDDIPITSPAGQIMRHNEERRETERGSELEPLENHEAKSHNRGWLTDEFQDEDLIATANQSRYSVSDSPVLSPTAEPVINEREVITHYRDIDHGIVGGKETIMTKLERDLKAIIRNELEAIFETELKTAEERLGKEAEAAIARPDVLDASIQAEAEAKEASAKKAAEEAEWIKNLEEEAKLKAEIEARKKIEEDNVGAEVATAAAAGEKKAGDALNMQLIQEAMLKAEIAARKKIEEERAAVEVSTAAIVEEKNADNEFKKLALEEAEIKAKKAGGEAKSFETSSAQNDHLLTTLYAELISSSQNSENVSDLAERKRIQNRLVQRAYRRSLRERLNELEAVVEAGDSADQAAETDSKQPVLTSGEEIISKNHDSGDSSVADLNETNTTSIPASENIRENRRNEKEANTTPSEAYQQFIYNTRTAS
ncbi:hypothetical protein F5Y03DRAFT_375300 [Xylaria venustula]|nr:hypothetical protein F5Y03DRAFT_375300 [Xylaria venustula]